MWRRLAVRAQRRYGAALASEASASWSATQSQCSAMSAHPAFVFSASKSESTVMSIGLVAMGGAAALAASMAFAQDAQCASTAPNSTDRAEGGYRENPIQHVAALLRLYDEIDRNMDVLTNRMLQDLQRRVEEEKKANDGKLKLSPEQIALSMSIEFESTLEKVQDAVFRNNYVTKEEVQDALQRMVRGELRGSGRKGEITVQEAEAIEGFVKQLGRMRWKVTGSREPLLPTQAKPLVKQEKPKIPLETVTQVMEKLIPSLTTEMEKIVRDVRAKESKLSKAQQHQLISKAYIKRSGELTEKLCAEKKLDMREFQAALIYYHDDPVFEKSLARLSAEQQRKFAEWGL